jgi:hypothetical protein
VTRTARAHHGPTTRPVVVDLPTVITVLYVGPFTPADWQRLGPAAVAAFVVRAAADPAARVPELTVLLAAARLHGLTGIAADHLAAAEKFAPAVLAAATAGR